MASEGGPLSKKRSVPVLLCSGNSGDHNRGSGSGSGMPMAAPSRPDESSSILQRRNHQRKQNKHRGEQHQGTGGVMGVPGRIIATLQRKFWDSNKVWAGMEADNCVLLKS